MTRTRIVTYRQANRVRTSEVTGFIGDVFTAVQSVQVANAESRVVERFRVLNDLPDGSRLTPGQRVKLIVG